MAALLNECLATYYTEFPECATNILINVGLIPDTDYYVKLNTPLGRQYTTILTSDGSGDLSLPVASLPEMLLNRWAGPFTIRIFDSGDKCTIQNFPVCGANYDTIVFDIVQQVGEINEKLICECQE